jgi:hypothetical protein
MGLSITIGARGGGSPHVAGVGGPGAAVPDGTGGNQRPARGSGVTSTAGVDSGPDHGAAFTSSISALSGVS